MEEYVEKIPGVNGLAKEAGKDVYKIATLIEDKTKELKSLKREVDKIADSELSQPSVSAETVEVIKMIKEDAAKALIDGATNLQQGMDAASTLF